MRNWKLIAIQLGDQYKTLRSVKEIERLAAAIFPFSRQSYRNHAITSERAKVVYDWVMTLSDQDLPVRKKQRLLEQFESSLHSIPFERVPPEGQSVAIDVWRLVHREIQRVAKDQFEHGHYAPAVLAAMIEVNSRVKKIVRTKTGKDWDGAELMQRAFSVNNPVIVLGDVSTDSGHDMQQGYMEIFAGAMMGVRNPKAHENITISPERALHFLVLASLLMHKLDEAVGASLDELKKTYDQHHHESGKQFPPEKQCQCEKCKLYRSLATA